MGYFFGGNSNQNQRKQSDKVEEHKHEEIDNRALNEEKIKKAKERQQQMREEFEIL